MVLAQLGAAALRNHERRYRGAALVPNILTRRESDDQAARLRLQDEERGFTFWAVELPGAAPFIGFVGLLVVRFQAPFTPAVEIGWRLAQAYWGRGYATEAAGAAWVTPSGRSACPRSSRSPCRATRRRGG